MPPTFAFIICLCAYLAISVLIFLVAGILSAFKATRRLGIRIAAGALLSFPGMILFQIIVFPFAIIAMLSAGACFWLLGSCQELRQYIEISFLLLSVCIFAAGSAFGIYFGYRTAWIVFGGAPWGSVMRSDYVVAFAVAAFQKLQKNAE